MPHQAEPLHRRLAEIGRLETFARLHVSPAGTPHEQHRVELVANWRAQPPVEMQIGPVLHPDDVMAGKMDALYNRAAARDFIDYGLVASQVAAMRERFRVWGDALRSAPG